MEKKIAIVYEFDQTLSPKFTTSSGYLPAMGICEEDFGQSFMLHARKEASDVTAAYMQELLASAVGKAVLTERSLKGYGAAIEFFLEDENNHMLRCKR